MPSDASFRQAFLDIKENILLARLFIEDQTFNSFKKSRLHFYAVTRAVELISESTRRLPDEVRRAYPDLPWRSIRDAGNIYRHDYDHVAEALV